MTDDEKLAPGVALLPELRRNSGHTTELGLTYYKVTFHQYEKIIAALEAAEALSQENRVLEDMLGKFKDYRRKLEAELVVVKKGLKNTTAERIAKPSMLGGDGLKWDGEGEIFDHRCHCEKCELAKQDQRRRAALAAIKPEKEQ